MTEPKSEPRWRARLKAAGFAFVLLGASTLVGLGIAELLVRVVAPQQLILLRPDLWTPADSVGWTRRPNVDVVVNTGERPVRVRTDARGFRVAATGPGPDRAGVLLLGDSFVEALQVEYEQSLAGRLEDTLPDLVGRPVRVYNAGINGWGPSQYLIKGREVLATDDIDVVVAVVYVGNDALPVRLDHIPPRAYAERYRFRFPRALSTTEFVDALLRPVNDQLEVRSHLYVLVRNRLQALRMRAGLSPLYFPQEFLRSEADAERWSLTADILADIAAAAADRGAKTLFVLVPADFQVNEAAFEQYVRGFGIDTSAVDLEQPNHRLADEMTERGLRFIDVLEAFREARRNGPRLYGAVDPHLTPQGHAVLNRIVAPEVATLMAGDSTP